MELVRQEVVAQVVGEVSGEAVEVVAGWEAIGQELDPAGSVSAPIAELGYPIKQERPAII